MSTAPTRYYASRPSSRPTSPLSSAEVRSQAVAKLKRAASLPRNANGRRPSGGASVQPQLQGNGDAQIPHSQNGVEREETIAGPSTAAAATSSSSAFTLAPAYPSGHSPSPSDGQEVLSPSPVNSHFDHANMYTSPSAGMMMQRSASASSSYHMATPPHLAIFNSHHGSGGPGNAGYFGAPSPNGQPDWAAMQLAHSFLPSLSPAGVGVGPSSFTPQGSGRNTPSPLPTLGELRTLQRSNSAAARAHAMSKLTGGRDTPSASDDEYTPVPVTARPNLQRADSLGATKLLAVSQSRARDVPTADEDTPVAHDLPRPRLQRSFTVSSSNMGEERRSAVGRRMVAQLGKRRAAREKEEEEVRKLWEERRATAETESESGEVGSDKPQQQDGDDDDDAEAQEVPVVERTSPTEEPVPHYTQPPHSHGEEMLAAPDRPVSRGTMRSEGEAFEYEAHLRRSLSSRTARGAVGTVTEANVRGDAVDPPLPDTAAEQLQQLSITDGDDDELGLPKPFYSTPTRHNPHASTSTQATIQGSQSPGDSIISRDALGSMMFVMGSGTGSGPPTGVSPGEGNWPSEVEDHSGSDWGTPARDLHQPTFSDSPMARSPLAAQGLMPQQPVPLFPGQASPRLESSGDAQDDVTPPGTSQRTSGMSWEEVGGPEDQAVPSDEKYSKNHKKSGSISAKLGRNLRTAMRKRSQSRSSLSSSNEGGHPTSPNALSIAIQNFSSRRASASSLSPSQSSAASKSFSKGSPNLLQGEHVKHQPSISSLSPSLPSQGESANSILLQHQLSGDPSPVSWLPRAELNDPRIHNSKLSPFPGIAHLERRNDGTPETPKLVHQSSDSVVPSQQRVTPAPPGAESIYSLPLPPTSPDSRRASDDSVTKRSWLAKAFASASSPRSSGSGVSRQNSSGENVSRTSSRKGSVDGHSTSASGHAHGQVDADPFAAPPPPPPAKSVRHRSASPSVSVVPEDSEEGSRLTRFTAATTRFENNSPLIEEQEDKGDRNRQLTPHSMDVLNRMDDLLALGPDDPARPDILDDPPRKLLLATQILQVVNAHTAKDRFLFLFNDIMVITKPLINQGVVASLDMKFLVKSIVSLDKLKVTGFEDELAIEPPRHAVVNSFIEQFAENPVTACKYLVERSNPRVDAVTLASLIFKTPELDRSQIGNLLSSNERLMRAFIDRFDFSGTRIDDALRMFLLSIRLPDDPTASEILLMGFAHRYFQANQETLSFQRELAVDLVLWIMQLNDFLYGMYGFAQPNSSVTLDTLIAEFQSNDPHGLVSSDLLADIYSSLKRARLDQALTTEQDKEVGRQVLFTPQRLPSKLTYNVWSDLISVTLPQADSHFRVKLLGDGLEFDPPLLEFRHGRTAQFRVRGSLLGTKSVLFDRGGRNAPLYSSLGNARTLTVERAFMRHTFQVSFTSHVGLKRKYCFSVSDAATRAKWARHLQEQILITASSRRHGLGVGGNDREAIRSAAEVVSLQVLRDALIPPESTSDIGAIGLGQRDRAGSVSLTYSETQGREESELGPLQPGKAGPVGERASGMMEIQTGKELVLMCRQNSLLPGVLELLQAGIPHSGGGGESSGNGSGLERVMSKRERGVGGRV